jgi:acetyl-CoA carboxylase carboxyl transferase subunit beta
LAADTGIIALYTEKDGVMSWLTQLLLPKIRSLGKKRDVPEHLWVSCSGCTQMVFQKHLEDKLFVCSKCGHHMAWPVNARLAHLFDEGLYDVLPSAGVAADPLGFRDQKKYTDRLKDARQKTGQPDSVIVAVGKVARAPVVASCFNFGFIGGSMGMAAGESLIQGARMAVEKRACYLIVASSGGARMQEGILSLMQMPRSVIALQMVKEAGLPVVMLLAHPTTGGVAASFAALGDLTFAEPGAIIGFTGARVIQDTLRQPLPDGFQTSEFQKKHGFVDLITERSAFRTTFSDVLRTLNHLLGG